MDQRAVKFSDRTYTGPTMMNKQALAQKLKGDNFSVKRPAQNLIGYGTKKVNAPPPKNMEECSDDDIDFDFGDTKKAKAAPASPLK